MGAPSMFYFLNSFTGGQEFALIDSAEQSVAMRVLRDLNPDFAGPPLPRLMI
jgi:hypothetical protein